MQALTTTNPLAPNVDTANRASMTLRAWLREPRQIRHRKLDPIAQLISGITPTRTKDHHHIVLGRPSDSGQQGCGLIS